MIKLKLTLLLGPGFVGLLALLMQALFDWSLDLNAGWQGGMEHLLFSALMTILFGAVIVLTVVLAIRWMGHWSPVTSAETAAQKPTER